MNKSVSSSQINYDVRAGKALQIVNSHCGILMQGYSKCVDKYPNHWDTACSYQRHELARCSETHPVMVKVKLKCNSLFQNYEKCQRKFPDDFSSCAQGFNDFLNCVENVASKPHSS